MRRGILQAIPQTCKKQLDNSMSLVGTKGLFDAVLSDDTVERVINNCQEYGIRHSVFIRLQKEKK